MIDDNLGHIDENGYFVCAFCGSTYESEKELINHLNENAFIVESD